MYLVRVLFIIITVGMICGSWQYRFKGSDSTQNGNKAQNSKHQLITCKYKSSSSVSVFELHPTCFSLLIYQCAPFSPVIFYTGNFSKRFPALLVRKRFVSSRDVPYLARYKRLAVSAPMQNCTFYNQFVMLVQESD